MFFSDYSEFYDQDTDIACFMGSSGENSFIDSKQVFYSQSPVKAHYD